MTINSSTVHQPLGPPPGWGRLLPFAIIIPSRHHPGGPAISIAGAVLISPREPLAPQSVGLNLAVAQWIFAIALNAIGNWKNGHRG
jgi:hypothetical protein